MGPLVGRVPTEGPARPSFSLRLHWGHNSLSREWMTERTGLLCFTTGPASVKVTSWDSTVGSASLVSQDSTALKGD